MTHWQTTGGRIRPHAMALGRTLAAAAGLAVLTQITWNIFAPDLFGLPELRMKQALGMVGFGIAMTLLLRQGPRQNSSQPPHPTPTWGGHG